MRKDDDRKILPVLAQSPDKLRSLFGVPAAEKHRQDLAAVRPLEQGKRHLLVCRANNAPAGTPGDCRDQATLFRIRIHEQQ